MRCHPPSVASRWIKERDCWVGSDGASWRAVCQDFWERGPRSTLQHFQPEGGREFVRNQGGALNTPFCVYWEEEEEGAKMEALVAINWRGWGRVRETATKTCTIFLGRFETFLKSESCLSTFVVEF